MPGNCGTGLREQHRKSHCVCRRLQGNDVLFVCQPAVESRCVVYSPKRLTRLEVVYLRQLIGVVGNRAYSLR